MDFFQRFRESEAKDLREEVEFCFNGTLDVLSPSEAMLLSLERYVCHGNSFFTQGLEHGFRLVRRDDLVFEALEEDDGRRKEVCEVDWRALDVKVSPLWIRTHEAI